MAKTSRSQPPRQLSDSEVRELILGLHDLYPDADCELRHSNPLELLVATILSAQCTDERVNKVTETLFEKYPSAADYAAADVETFEQDVRPTGFYRNKTKLVLGAARRIVEAYGGEVPESMEDLLTLPGVARKTANLVLGTAFGQASGVVVDTHVRRLSQRLGLSTQKNPDKVEQRPDGDACREEEWIFMGYAVILHGRQGVQGAGNRNAQDCGLARTSARATESSPETLPTCAAPAGVRQMPRRQAVASLRGRGSRRSRARSRPFRSSEESRRSSPPRAGRRSVSPGAGWRFVPSNRAGSSGKL